MRVLKSTTKLIQAQVCDLQEQAPDPRLACRPKQTHGSKKCQEHRDKNRNENRSVVKNWKPVKARRLWPFQEKCGQLSLGRLISSTIEGNLVIEEKQYKQQKGSLVPRNCCLPDVFPWLSFLSQLVSVVKLPTNLNLGPYWFKISFLHFTLNGVSLCHLGIKGIF